MLGKGTIAVPGQAAMYTILVVLGILGNGTVIVVLGENVTREIARVPGSDIILLNLALCNLLISLLRNIVLTLADFGIEFFISEGWCRMFMCLWVWLRAVNVWSTFYLSAFHYHTLHRLGPTQGQANSTVGFPRILMMGLGMVWALNLLYSLPAWIYAKNSEMNFTETIMLISSTTRQLLGCVWNFPSPYTGLAYATSSLVIHEMIPIVLMSITNVGSLRILYGHRQEHSRNKAAGIAIIRRIPAERRAAKVILALVLLFTASWGTSIISINYYNYNRGQSTEFLIVLTRFANTTFIAFCPIVLAFGHRRIRAVVKSIIPH